MYIPYKRMVLDRRETIKVDIDEIEYCCDDLSLRFGNYIALKIDPDWNDDPIFVGLLNARGLGREIDQVPFDHCPFCGSEIVFEKLGTFERVVTEKKVSE